MSAYVLLDIRVSNPEAYEGYKALADPLVERFGGTFLARGGELDIRETDLWSPTRLVLVEFPDMDSARAFLDSDEYAPVAALRHANADCTAVIVDGV